MTTILEAFKQQLDNLVFCNGDYLNGKAIDDVILSMVTEDASDGAKLQARVAVERKIKEYADHIGQHNMFFIDVSVADIKEVKNVWSGDLDDLISNYELDEASPSWIATPLLRKKVTI